MNTIGIYKITSPTGKIYVGQSCNVEKRFERYRIQRCTQQPKLFKSLCKYGYINHNFEIIEICNLEQLNEKEHYWQIYYDVLNKGLNSRIDSFGKVKVELSKETRFKLGSSFRNKHTANSIKVKCLKTGTIYPSIKNCAKLNNINYNTLKQQLNNNYNSKTKDYEII